ncbi:Uncharacterised protein [Streptococcus constellatus]|uniref:Uncharacterized protein n=1 Tax=Streptococcus constellatus TaxID=76860 RepID=A0A564TU69_STRCV|nr:Uncharacterised protein [Streptococcus constellatus]VUX13094.1 Uncharacterised protein [Streptococcus gordonii]
MIKQCYPHFLVNQKKAEKHVFRKSKKYRTLCSVALGTVVTAIVAWGGAVLQADEVTTPQLQDNIIQRTENPATNLAQVQPAPVVEQTNSLASNCSDKRTIVPNYGIMRGKARINMDYMSVRQVIHRLILNSRIG